MRLVAAALLAGLPALAFAQGGSGNHKGLEMSVTGIARTGEAALRDCPPGSNTVRATTKPGEEFAVVTVAFKVTPAFKEMIVKKPVLTAADGKTYNTAVSFIDPASVASYSCAFPFRVPTGTALKSLQVEGVTLDLAGLDKK